jgi:hypothetical protein
MLQPTKVQTQSDTIYVAEGLLAISAALEDDDLDLEFTDENIEAFEADLLMDDGISEILELSALSWMEIAQWMTGDGTRGSYDQIPKSADFFSVCLQALVRVN